MTRVEEEIDLVRAHFPALEVQPDKLWARIPVYEVPDGLWLEPNVEVVFQFPPGLPGQQPYGFWVRPRLQLVSGAAINNFTFPVTTPFGEGFGQFSWAPEVWEPQAGITAGSNMLDFVRSFRTRLAEGA
jgi:hypothetical protein